MLYVMCTGRNGSMQRSCHTPAINMAETIEYSIRETEARVVTIQADGDELTVLIEALRNLV